MCRALMYRGLSLALAVAGSSGGAIPAATPDSDQIVRESVAAIKSDWAEAPKYSYLERDVETKRHSARMPKTYRVLMIDGSPYNVVTAINDQPLPAGEKAAEQGKLQNE